MWLAARGFASARGLEYFLWLFVFFLSGEESAGEERLFVELKFYFLKRTFSFFQAYIYFFLPYIYFI